MIFYCVFWAFENWTRGFYLTAVVSKYLRKSLRYGGWELVHIPWDYMFWYVLKIPLFSHCGYVFWFILPSYLQIWSSCMMYQNFDELYDNLHRCHFKSFQDGCVKGQYILIITFFFYSLSWVWFDLTSSCLSKCILNWKMCLLIEFPCLQCEVKWFTKC